MRGAIKYETELVGKKINFKMSTSVLELDV